MQLKLKRSQRVGGLTGGTAIFCLDARADLTAEEQQSVKRYKLGNQVIYNSEASKKALERSEHAQNGSTVGNLKSLGFAALALMKLNISVNSLQKGQHIECKSLDELLGAEDALMTACQNLRGYLDTAASFDGREIVIDFSTTEGVQVASATPGPILASAAAAPRAIAHLATVPQSMEDAYATHGDEPYIVSEADFAPEFADRPPPPMPLSAPDLSVFLGDVKKMAGGGSLADSQKATQQTLIVIGTAIGVVVVGALLQFPLLPSIIFAIMIASGTAFYLLRR